jgi:hypothetical protein
MDNSFAKFATANPYAIPGNGAPLNNNTASMAGNPTEVQPPAVTNEISHPAHSTTFVLGDDTADNATTVQCGTSPSGSQPWSLAPPITTLHMRLEMVQKWELRASKKMLPTETKPIFFWFSTLFNVLQLYYLCQCPKVISTIFYTLPLQLIS